MPAVETTGIRDEVRLKTQLRRAAAIVRHDFPRLGNEVIAQWNEHRVPRLGASLAFYTLLSLAPLVIIVVAVAGAFFGREAVEGQLVWQIEDIVGRAGAETVQNLLKSTQHPGAGTLASILGSIALAVGATSGIAELRDALNIIWCVPRKEESGLQSIVSILRDKWLAFLTVLGIGFFLLVSVVFSTALSWVTGYFPSWAVSAALLRFADLGITFIVISLLFTLIYKWLPDLRLEWRDVIPGALITTVLFSIGRYLIGFYLGRSSYASLYGAAGSLVVLLVWVYYSAQIFYLGVEFARAWAQAYGSKPCDRIGREVKLAAEPAEPVPASSSEPLIKVT